MWRKARRSSRTARCIPVVGGGQLRKSGGYVPDFDRLPLAWQLKSRILPNLADLHSGAAFSRMGAMCYRQSGEVKSRSLDVT